jgi:hypothetical protein
MNKLEHKIPTFAPGPVKKEIMQCLRDIALDEQEIRYHGYSDGIVIGCGLVEENMKIGLVNGIVKYAGRLYKLRGKALVPYEPTDDWTVLKLRFAPQTKHREYIIYTAGLVLDTNTGLLPNEMEIGRFKLKKGSSLRTSYKDFWDMGTEYDTVNLVHVNQSARGSPTLSPAITTHFAREAFPHLDGQPLDSAFCVACLQTGGQVNRELITRYVCNRLEREYEEMDNVSLHQGLAQVLDMISGRASHTKGRGKADGVMLIN